MRYLKYTTIKNILDRSIALISLIILLPLFLIFSLLVRLDLGRPIFFVQERPGYKCKLFGLIKFRTMREMNNKEKFNDDNKRISSLGKFLRATSIDELPSLFNIIKGDMSFVGPRPFVKKYLKFYNDEQLRRHDVKPGITGLAQINGRNLISWKEKFEYDLYYVDKKNFFLDMKILFHTFFKVILMKGINSSKDLTMKEFDGN